MGRVEEWMKVSSDYKIANCEVLHRIGGERLRRVLIEQDSLSLFFYVII